MEEITTLPAKYYNVVTRGTQESIITPQGHKRPVKQPKGAPAINLTPALEDRICEGIAEGMPLTMVCKEIGIGYSTVHKWLLDNNNMSFIQKYTQARSIQADNHADQIHEVVIDRNIPSDEKNAMINGFKWLAGVKAPKKYGKQSDPLVHIDINTTQAAAELKTLSVDQVKQMRDIMKGSQGEV